MFNKEILKLDKNDLFTRKSFICPRCYRKYTVKSDPISIPKTIFVDGTENWKDSYPEIEVKLNIKSPCHGELMFPVDVSIAEQVRKLNIRGYKTIHSVGIRILDNGRMTMPGIIMEYSEKVEKAINEKIKESNEDFTVVYTVNGVNYYCRLNTIRSKDKLVLGYKNAELMYGEEFHRLSKKELRFIMDLVNMKFLSFILSLPDLNKEKVVYDLKEE